MSKKLILTLILILGLVFVSGCVDMNCISDDDCPKNYRCYNSQKCAMGENGVECGPQEGDLMCHKLCSTRIECDYLSGCKEFTIFKEDKTEQIELCS